MTILDRFSTNLKDALNKSIQLATQLESDLVYPIHLLFILQNQKGSVAAEILNRLKTDIKILEALILELPYSDKQKTGQVTEVSLTALSESSKLAVEKALVIAQKNSHNYVGTEHLLYGLLEIKDEKIEKALEQNKIKLEDIKKQLNIILTSASQFPEMNEVMEVMEKIQDQITNNEENEPLSIMQKNKKRDKKEAALEFFATNLTDPKAQKNIDPIIGRENEIERLIQILCRRTKNNPVLLGDPGVGKTAIVEGLAKRILNGEVPDVLLNKKVYSLDIGLMIAGTIYRGEFEGRLRQVIDDVSKNPDIILFIDELHNIVGAGSNQGTMDAANILKPALARGQIHCIGSTTIAEFKKHIENDAALERRFQPIMVKEPSLEDTIKILDGIKTNYELFHNIKIDQTAIEAAVKLSDRYVHNKFLPDKAIDLLDETASAKKIGLKKDSWIGKIERLKQKLEKITLAKETAALSDKFEEAVKLKTEEEKVQKELSLAKEKSKTKKIKFLATINEQDILTQVAKIIGTKPTELMLEQKNDLLKLEEQLKERVVGQDKTVTEVAKVINRARLGLSSTERPLASFLFVGQSGVGKTELAKTIADCLYPNQNALIKLDMSEFNESFGVSKLLGSPAGYIGYKESNGFTDKIKNNPHCVILFDEIDKAHRDVVRLLLQILENGEITDSTGKKISLKHAIIILTTSLFSDEAQRAVFGFGDQKDKMETAGQKINDKLKEFLSAEIINRLDKICLFKTLDKEDLSKIAHLEINNLNKQLASHNTIITSKKSVLLDFINNLNEKDVNARTIRRELRTELEKIISELILGKKYKKEYEISFKEKQVTLK